MSSTPNTQPSDTAPCSAVQVRDRAAPASEGTGVYLTELAAEKVREYIGKMDSPATTYLYFGAKGGGCSGLTYVLDLRDERNAPVAEMDEVFDSYGVIIVCDFKSYEVGNLAGTKIDFEEGLMGKGFTFHNPNAKHSCGCGSSYSA